MIDRARELRSALTISERRLWSWLRNRSFSGYKFRRQVPMGRYNLDFYCPELKLAIEVDGRDHELPCVSEYDTARTKALEKHGIYVLRIDNETLAKEPWLAEEQVRFGIGEAVRKLDPSSALRETTGAIVRARPS